MSNGLGGRKCFLPVTYTWPGSMGPLGELLDTWEGCTHLYAPNHPHHSNLILHHCTLVLSHTHIDTQPLFR